MSPIIAITTLPDPSSVDALARSCVDEGLAACAQVEGGLRSFYSWKGETCCDEETRLWLKSDARHLSRLETHVMRAHPYDTPQWILWKDLHVSETYGHWLLNSLKDPP